MKINECINTDHFVWFLYIMNDWLESNDFFNYSKVIILLDKCSIHKSKIILSVLRQMKFSIWYFTPNYSDFTSVEMWFGNTKRNLRELWKWDEVLLKLKENHAKDYDLLIIIKSITIKKVKA